MFPLIFIREVTLADITKYGPRGTKFSKIKKSEKRKKRKGKTCMLNICIQIHFKITPGLKWTKEISLPKGRLIQANKNLEGRKKVWCIPLHLLVGLKMPIMASITRVFRAKSIHCNWCFYEEFKWLKRWSRRQKEEVRSKSIVVRITIKMSWFKQLKIRRNKE